MSNPQFSWMIRIAQRKGDCNSRDPLVREIADREWGRTETGYLKWISLNCERDYLARLWNQAVKESTSETAFCPHCIDQRLSPITGKKEDAAIIAGPARGPCPPVERSTQLLTVAAAGIDHPNVSVLRHAVDRRHLALRRDVGNPVAIRRPDGLVLAAFRIRDLAHLPA